VNTRITLAIVMAAAVPAAAWGQTAVPNKSDDVHRYDQIRVMEGTLIGSVSLAANQVAREVQSRTPGVNLFTGEARAKGFTLDGYGAFFYVEIPALDLNLVLSMETLDHGPQQRRGEAASVAQRTNQVSDVQSATDDALRNVAAEDPGQKYREAVKRCLIDAMLDHSKSMDLGPDEWLTVAARGSESGLIPGEIYQLKTLELKVKGSDLADFLAGRLSRDEARQKVAVRQF
jgi:hypothetical protein